MPVDVDVVRTLALQLPNVEDASSPRGAGFKVGGRLLACAATHQSAEPNSWMVRIGLEERARLLADSPDAFYVTGHYEKHASVLVRLARVDRDALRNVLGIAWAFVSEKAVKPGARSSKRRVRVQTSARKRRRRTSI
jgi:hypothetical protein